MKLIVASQNPVKLDAVQQGVEELWPNITPNILGVHVPSGVRAQPMDEKETLQGARNRVTRAIEQVTSADYWIGIEGGVQDIEGKMAAFAWIVASNGEKYGEARTASLFLPLLVAELVRSGIELGVADDQVFGSINSKQKNGAIGLLTHNAITRKSLYVPAVIMAMIPFIRPEFY